MTNPVHIRFDATPYQLMINYDYPGNHLFHYSITSEARQSVWGIKILTFLVSNLVPGFSIVGYLLFR